jgi:hypothetical protein
MHGSQTIAEFASHASPNANSVRPHPGFNTRWLVIAIVLLGLGVRCRQYLAAPSFWYDEAYVLVNVFEKSFGQLAGPLRCEQAAPPAFLWSLRGLYVTVGGSEWAMRAPAFAASVLAVIVMIPLARNIVGGAGGWWAIGFLSVSQTAIFHTVCVKPYAGDLLATVIVLCLGAIALDSRPIGRGWVWIGLMVSGLIVPWCSYPGVFSLAAATMALSIDAAWNREQPRRSFAKRLTLPMVFTLVWLTSFFTVWLAIGRVQHSNYLADYWKPFFLDRSSPAAALAWIGHTLLKLGHYGTSGMQWPLILLAGYGQWRLGRISFTRLVLVTGPMVMMFVASAMGFYPLEDRLFYFALPCLWLLAAAGIDGLLSLDWRRWRPAIVFLLAVPLMPGAVRYVYWLAVVPEKVEYREAFEYVREREQTGDAWWISHPEVYEVYFGKDRPCNIPLSVNQRAWLLMVRGCDEQAMVASMHCQSRRLVERHDMKTISVMLFDAETIDQSRPSER